MKFKILLLVLLSRSICAADDQPTAGQTEPVNLAGLELTSPDRNLQSTRPISTRHSLLQRINGKEFERLGIKVISDRLKNLLFANDFRNVLKIAARPKQPDLSGMSNRKLDSQSQADQQMSQEDIDAEIIGSLEEQKLLLLIQFYEVIESIEDDRSVADPCIGKLLTNYLQHLEYIYVKENQFAEYVTPVLYNYKTDTTIAPYSDSPDVTLPDESFLQEQGSEIVQLFDEYNKKRLSEIEIQGTDRRRMRRHNRHLIIRRPTFSKGLPFKSRRIIFNNSLRTKNIRKESKRGCRISAQRIR